MDIKDRLIYFSAGNLYWKNINGVYQGCNLAFAKLLKLAQPEDIIGKTDHDLFKDKEMAEKICVNDQHVIKNSKEITIEETGLDENGKLAIYLSKKVPLKNDQNEVIGLVGTSIDITQQKQAEIAKSEFIANMRHDLRTPFTVILTLNECLYNQESDPFKKELLADAVTSAKRLLDLHNQILEVASLSARPLNIEPFNLKALVEEIGKSVKADVTRKKLKLQIECQELIIVSDRLRLNRILLNLVDNAIKFTERGKITLKAKVDNKLRIQIKDTGIGIAEERVENIFERFVKLTPSYAQTAFTGTGLGLYISKQFAQDLGGKLSVESMVGKGSSFTLTLPKKVITL